MHSIVQLMKQQHKLDWLALTETHMKQQDFLDLTVAEIMARFKQICRRPLFCSRQTLKPKP